MGRGRGADLSLRRAGGIAVQIPVEWYLVLSAFLFVIGATGVLVRRNLFIVLFSIELMMNAVNLNLVAFSRLHENLIGQNFVLFTMTVAASAAATVMVNNTKFCPMRFSCSRLKATRLRLTAFIINSIEKSTMNRFLRTSTPVAPMTKTVSYTHLRAHET